MKAAAARKRAAVDGAAGTPPADGPPAASPPLLSRIRFRAAGRLRRAGLVAAMAIAVLVPLLVESQFRLRTLVFIFINATLAVGLVPSLGLAGQFNLSQGTFYGLGAYTTAILLADVGAPFEVAILCAGLVAGTGGLLFGVASLRVRGDYFALLSLAFTIAAVQVMENAGDLTRGREGFAGIPEATIFGASLNGIETAYYATLAALVVAWIVVARVKRSFAGRAMLAVRYDEVGARMMGINVAYTKLVALVVSSAIAGVAGAFLVATVGFIAPSNFGLLPSINSTIYVIIGGMTSIGGAAVATGMVLFFTEQFRQIAQFSVGLLAVVVLVAVFYRGGVIRDLVRSRWR